MAENPYLALLQQERPRGNWMDLLSNALLGVGSGISQAGSSGQGWGAGIAPGLLLGNQMTAQAEHAAEQERMRRLQFGLQAQEWDEKRKIREQQAAAMDKWQKLMTGGGAPDQGATTPGITAPQASPVKMGPDLVAAGTPVVNYLTAQHGFSPLAAATVAGNLYQESGFNPGASGDSGTAFGMGQWRLDRQDKLKAFAASQQKPVTDPQVQLDYLVTEMKGGDMGAQRAYAQLQQAKTPQEANAAMMHFFRPQGYTPANPTGGHGFQNRVQYTQALLPNGQPVPQGVNGPQGSSPAGPPPSPPPQYASLPPFEGPGMGGIQPGATDAPTLRPPPPAPPQVAQGDNVTASGASVDPNAPMPAAVGGPLSPPGGPAAVPVQYNPTPATPSMAPQPQAPAGAPPLQPPTVPMPRPQDLPASYRQYLGSLPVTTPHEAMTATTQAMTQYRQQLQEQANKQWERQWSEYAHSRGLSEEAAKEQRRLETELVDVQVRGSNEVKSVTKAEALAGAKSGAFVPLKAGEVARAEAKQKMDVAQAKVNPDTLQPNQPLIQAETQQAAAITAAQEAAKLDTTAASALVTQAVKEFSDKERPKGLAIQETIPNIHNVRRLVEAGAITGTGTETRNYLAQLASTLGFKSNEAAITPAYLGAMADQIVANAKALGVNPTNRDNEIIAVAKGANPNVSKEGVLQLLDVQEQMQRRAHQRYIAEAKRIQSMRGVKQAYGDDYFMLPEPPTYPEYLKDNPLPGQPVPGQPSSVGKSPWELERERRGKMNSATPGR